MKLPDGTYKLARDVKNPNRNLRNKRDWTYFERWEKGDVFFLRTYINPIQGESWQELQLQGHARTLTQFSDAFALILMASERIDETPSLYLKRRREEEYALAILDHMHAKGVLTNDFIDACMSDLLAEWNKEDEES